MGARPRVDRGDAWRKTDVMQPHTILLVSSDHPQAAALRAALASWRAARVIGDVHHGDAAVTTAARLRPDAILLAADPPGRLLVPLARDLRAASPVSRLIVVGARRVLDRTTLTALLDLSVVGCLAWEEAGPAAVLACVAAALDGGALVCSPGLLATLLTAFDRRTGPRVEGLVLTPGERDAPAIASSASDALSSGSLRAALWADDPAIAASLRLQCAQAGILLDAVDTVAALCDAARRAALLFVDCSTAPDALDRCLTIVPHTTLPVYICHPDEGFVDDLRARAGGALTWLPPAWLGARLRDRLRLLAVASGASAAAPAPPHDSLTTREREVLRLTRLGRTASEIARQLELSDHTVKSHLANIRRKLPPRDPHK